MDIWTVIKAWRLIRPGRRIKNWRNKRRAKKGKPPLKEKGMLEGKKTYLGIAVFAVATLLGWLGIGGEAEATDLVTSGAQLIGTLIAVYGRWAARPQ